MKGSSLAVVRLMSRFIVVGVKDIVQRYRRVVQGSEVGRKIRQALQCRLKLRGL